MSILKRYGLVLRRDEDYIRRRVIKVELQERRMRRQPKRRFMDTA